MTVSASGSYLIKLESLFDLSITLNESEEMDYILNTSLLSVMGKLRVTGGVAFFNTGDDNFEVIVKKGKVTLESLPLEEVPEERFAIPKEGSAFFEAGARLVIPLRVRGRLWACLAIGNNIEKRPWLPEEMEYAALVATITAGALVTALNRLSLRSTIERMERKSQMLTTLFEMSREFNTLLEHDEIVRLLGFRLMGQLAVSRFALVCLKEDCSRNVIVDRLRYTLTAEQYDILPNIEEPLIIKPENTSSAMRDLLAAGVELLVPVTTGSNSRAMLLVGSKLNKRPFSDEDIRFLEAIASIVLTALENVRLFKEEIEKKRMEEELSIAASIQRQLLPDTMPHAEGYDIAALNISSREVGGDYYDAIIADDKKILFGIADVSGKGTPASLLMANTQAALRTLAALRLPAAEIVTRLNDLLYHNTASDKFVTFFLLLLDPQTHSLTYVNAGHNPPLHIRKNNNSVEYLSEGGMLLGIMETFIPYNAVEVHIEPGDTIFLFTDGVTEALDKEGREFTDAALERLLTSATYDNMETLLQEVLRKIRKHSHGVPQTDDITMIAIQRKECEE